MHQTAASTEHEWLSADANLAHALLDLSEFANVEELRFRAILKAQEVVEMIDQALLAPSGGPQPIEKIRDDLQARLDRAFVR